MTEQAWAARSLRNWLWFSHHASAIQVGVHCASLGSVCYEINGQTTTLLLNGKKMPGGNVPFSTSERAKKELLEGERLHWKWTLSEGIVELQNHPSGRCLRFLTGHCLIEDQGRQERLDCPTLPRTRAVAPIRQVTATEPPKQDAPALPPMQPAAETPADHWTDSIPDEAVRLVLKHLERHGTINEDEVIKLLDSPRLARAFGNKLDQYRASIPFDVCVYVDATSTSGQKLYRKL